MRLTSSALTVSLLSAASLGSIDAFTFFTPTVLKRTYSISTSLEALYTPRTVQNTFLDVDFEKCESSELYSEAVKNTSPMKDTMRAESDMTTSPSNQIPSIPFSVIKKKPSNISETFDNDFQRAVDAMHNKIRQESSPQIKTSDEVAPDLPSSEPLSWSTDQPKSSFGNNGYHNEKNTISKVPKTLTNMFRKKEKESLNSLQNDVASGDEIDVSVEAPSTKNPEHDYRTDYSSTNNWIASESENESVYEDIYHGSYSSDKDPLIPIPYFIAEPNDEIEMSHTFTLDSGADKSRFQKKESSFSEKEKKIDQAQLNAVIANQKKLIAMKNEIMSTNHRLTASDLIPNQEIVDEEDDNDQEESTQEDIQPSSVQYESKKKKKIDEKDSIRDLPLSTAISNQKQLLATSTNHKRVTVNDLIPKHDQESAQYQETQTAYREKKVEEFYNMDPITRLPQMVNLKHMNQYDSSHDQGGVTASHDYGAHMPQGGSAGYGEQQFMSNGPFYQGYSGSNSQQGYGGAYQNGYNGPMSTGANRGNLMVSPHGDIIDLKFVGGNPGMSYGTASSSRYNNSAGINIMGEGYRPGYDLNVPMPGMGAYGGPSGYGSFTGPSGQNGSPSMAGDYNHYGMQGPTQQGPTHGAMHGGAQSGASWDSPQSNKMVLPQSVLGESGKCHEGIQPSNIEMY